MLKDPKTRLHLAADEAAKFVKETGCDSLACAIGTSTKTRNLVQPGSWPKFVRP
jgi:fructose/tagatose bisphosphate aldolase